MPGIFGLITISLAMGRAAVVADAQGPPPRVFLLTGTWIDDGWDLHRVDGAREFLLGRNAAPERAGDVTLVFSGEDTLNRHTVQSLKERGHQFKAAGPSYLVHYMRRSFLPEEPERTISRALADRTRGVATLFNDRYSMHRLYYHESKEAFLFRGGGQGDLGRSPRTSAGGSA